MTTTEVFAHFKFTYRGRCNCNGPKTDKYKWGAYTVYWSKAKKTFRLKNHGTPVTAELPEAQLYEVLNEIIQKAFENAAI
jgi:hypothetical protein